MILPYAMAPSPARRGIAFTVVTALAVTAPALGHGFNPAVYDLRERDPGRYEVVWRLPPPGAPGEQSHPDVAVHLPARCHAEAATASDDPTMVQAQRWTVDCGPRGLAGETLVATGLTDARLDVLVRYTPRDGATLTAVLRPDAPTFTLPSARGRSRGELARGYLGLGVEHILTGRDHLLFVLALLLLVRDRWSLLRTITAFTLGHSVTLALASLGLVRLPTAPVEAAIALSIALLAVELARPQGAAPTLARRYPWAVAAGFGLLHGFGFAGALADLGLPRGQIPLALAMFNVGVEVGQALFIGATLALWALGRRVFVRGPAWLARAAPYAIGTLATYWLFDRIGAFWE